MAITTEQPVTIARNMTAPPARLAWTIWSLGAALFLIAFYQRVAPAVMVEALMSDFQLGAAALGNLSAFYFYSYVAMQLPTGVLADRWGARRLLATGSFIAGLGSLLFGLAPTLLWANLGRLLIGGSVAVAFVTTLQLAARWFAPQRFALASGLTMLVGVTGGVFAGVPLQLAVAAYGWRPVMVASAILPFALGVAIWLIVRDDPEDKGYRSYAKRVGPQVSPSSGSALAGIAEVFSYRNSWLLTLIPGGVVGSVLTFSGLWGVPFLTTHYNYSATQAAALATTLLVAWAVGSPLVGSVADRFRQRKLPYFIGCLAALSGWLIIIFVPRLPTWLLFLLLIWTGLASGSIVIGYSYIKESVPAHLSGTAIAACNTGIILGPMVLQPAVGWVLDQGWLGQIEHGVRLYDLAAYRAGFSLMIGWLGLSLLLMLLTRETHGRQYHL